MAKRLQALSLLCPQHPKFHPGSKSAGHLIFKLPGLVNIQKTMDRFTMLLVGQSTISMARGHSVFPLRPALVIDNMDFFQAISGFRMGPQGPRAPGRNRIQLVQITSYL